MKRFVFIAVAAICVSCERPALEPWSVVCDKNGHYTFTEEDGRVWALGEWPTYQETYDYSRSIKAIAEDSERIQEYNELSVAALRQRNDIGERQASSLKRISDWCEHNWNRTP